MSIKKNPPAFEEEFVPYPEIPGTVLWQPKWSSEEEAEIAAGAEELRRNMSAIRTIREKLSLSQEELAELLGVTQSNVSKMEAKAEPRLSVLRRMIEHRGGFVKVVAVFNGEETVLPI